MISIYSKGRVLEQVEIDKVRISCSDSIYGNGKCVSVDLFGMRAGENPLLGIGGDLQSVVAFLRGLAKKLEQKDEFPQAYYDAVSFPSN